METAKKDSPEQLTKAKLEKWQREEDTIRINRALAEIGMRPINTGDAWEKQALCSAQSINPDIFDVTPTDVKGAERAKRHCAACAVKEECGADALNPNNPEIFLVRGGMTVKEQRTLRRRMKRSGR